MTTDGPIRRRPAQAARRLVGGVSIATAIGMVAVWSSTGAPAAAAPPAAGIRVVITDPAIDHDVAIAAALDAAAAGIDRVTVPTAGTAARDHGQVGDAVHSTTRAS